jgi:hypothetical protein
MKGGEYKMCRTKRYPKYPTKVYPEQGFEKLICDKLDRIIIFLTENPEAPFLKMAEYKEQYGR